MPIDFTPLSELSAEVQYSALDAPSAYIERHLKQAAILVARDLKVLTRKVRLDIQAGVSDYYLCPQEDERWHSVKSVCICGQCIEFAEPPCCERACKCSIGRYGYFEAPDKIVLSWSPTKDESDGIVVEMVALPKLDACSLDSWFAEVYMQAIQTKALANMRRDKGGKEPHSWYDPILARELDKIFQGEIMGRHKIDQATKYKPMGYEGPG